MQPIISRDGRLLAYTSNETGRREVYLQRFPEGGRKQRVTSTGGEDPLWGHDGTSLYFRWEDSIYKTEVIDGRIRGEPELVLSGQFEGRAGYGKANWDLTPEGKILVTSRLPSVSANRR